MRIALTLQPIQAICPPMGSQAALWLKVVYGRCVEQHGASPAGDRVTISLGMASLRPGHAISPERLLQHADDQLYRAKSEGRNQLRSVVLGTEHSDGPVRKP